MHTANSIQQGVCRNNGNNYTAVPSLATRYDMVCHFSPLVNSRIDRAGESFLPATIPRPCIGKIHAISLIWSEVRSSNLHLRSAACAEVSVGRLSRGSLSHRRCICSAWDMGEIGLVSLVWININEGMIIVEGKKCTYSWDISPYCYESSNRASSIRSWWWCCHLLGLAKPKLDIASFIIWNQSVPFLFFYFLANQNYKLLKTGKPCDYST